MRYRRFGRSEARVSVITLGGMRYAVDRSLDEPSPGMITECRESVTDAFASGINLIETAYGYSKSEACYGRVLNDELNVPRGDYYLMTKGSNNTASDTRRSVEEQLTRLKTDHIDFYAWHGMNTAKRQHVACVPKGPIQELLRLKAEGVIGHVGFSTHGAPDVIAKAIDTGLFDFVNLHYYYFLQRNLTAVQNAAARDMGVFIISPNDKGGMLYAPNPQLRALTSPTTPIQFNARFCLATAGVHTLAFGMHAPYQFEEMRGIFPAAESLSESDRKLEARLDAQSAGDEFSRYPENSVGVKPDEINVPEVLRLYRLWKLFGLEDYATGRFNDFGHQSHWYAGAAVTQAAEDKLDMSRVPEGIDLPRIFDEMRTGLLRNSSKISES